MVENISEIRLMAVWGMVAGLFMFMVFLTKGYLADAFSGKMILKTYEELSGLVKKKGRDFSWYRSMQNWLIGNGATYHYSRGIQPVSFLALSILCGLAGLAVLSEISVGYGMLAAGLLGMAPGWLLIYMNEQDNRKMLQEIKMVYHALELQLQAGVYVTDALAECYGSVREPRLRQALLDLAGDIVVKADIYQALERFQGKFRNRYIDALCITIMQALESGQAVELLRDISEQIKDMEKTVLERQKNALDRSVTFYQLGILAAVLAVALYAAVTNMMASSTLFHL